MDADRIVALIVGRFLETNGPVEDRDLELIVDAARRDVERRAAFLDGVLERKAASVAICRSLDWRQESFRPSYAELQERRARIYSGEDRVDFPGRAA